MTERAGQIGVLVRTMAAQLRDAVTGALGLAAHDLPVQKPHRVLVVEKVSRNAVAELVNQARNHPQRGDLASANPAYTALAELAANHGIDGLALGLKHETGEISFLDLDQSPEDAALTGGPFVSRALNKSLWRQLKKLVNIVVDRNMLGPRLPIRSPEDTADEIETDQEAEAAEKMEISLTEMEAAKKAAEKIEKERDAAEEDRVIEEVLREAAEAEPSEGQIESLESSRRAASTEAEKGRKPGEADKEAAEKKTGEGTYDKPIGKGPEKSEKGLQEAPSAEG